MSKLRILLLILLLLAIVAISVYYLQSRINPPTTTAETTTQAPTVSTTATSLTVTTTTETPVTTEDPYLPGTPELEFEVSAGGTATVVGISDKTIKNVRIPNYTPDGNRVTAIAYGAFMLNSAMESVIIPKNVYRIAPSAFYGCGALKTVTFSDGLEYIDYAAFENCAALESIHLPASLKDISAGAFAGCTALRHLTVSAENAVFTAEGNCLILKSERKLVLGCKDSKIPKDVVTIGEFAFYGAGLTQLFLPASVRVIENQAFAANRDLATLDLGETLQSLGDLAFADCASLTDVYLPASLVTIGVTPFRSCGKITHFAVAESNPAYYAETLCLVRKSDKTVIQGFAGATVPENIRAIGAWAFAYTSVREITLPIGAEVIAESAFAYSALESITLPKTVTEIAPNAFRQVSTLKTLTYGGSQERFDTLFNAVTLPSGITVTYGE